VQYGKLNQCFDGLHVSAHCLFGMTLPNNSVGESRNGNGFFQDGCRTKKKINNIHPHGPILIVEWQEQQKQLE
jgi:hypothetical protein